jgi:hypothetical protein
MNTPKKKYRKKSKETDEIHYTAEEAELLGLDIGFVDDEESKEDDSKEDEESYDEEEFKIDYDKKPKNKKKADKEKFYVDPKEFDTEIISYYESNILNDKLAQMVNKIAHKLSYAPNFINYSYREEMVGDGVIRMFKALMSKKYNHVKGTNPFSYFTRIAFNAFRNRIKKEKHIHETHEKYKNEFLMFTEGYSNIVKNNKNKTTHTDL